MNCRTCPNYRPLIRAGFDGGLVELPNCAVLRKCQDGDCFVRRLLAKRRGLKVRQAGRGRTSAARV